jgi:hypothetical protein
MADSAQFSHVKELFAQIIYLIQMAKPHLSLLSGEKMKDARLSTVGDKYWQIRAIAGKAPARPRFVARMA